MVMTIHREMIDEGASLFYDQGFRAVLETHMDYLRRHPESDFLTIETYPAHKYEYDLYGLLAYYKVDLKYHWLVMRMNELTSPTEYSSEVTALIIPSNTVINSIIQNYRTSNKVK